MDLSHVPKAADVAQVCPCGRLFSDEEGQPFCSECRAEIADTEVGLWQ